MFNFHHLRGTSMVFKMAVLTPKSGILLVSKQFYNDVLFEFRLESIKLLEDQLEKSSKFLILFVVEDKSEDT